MTRFVFLLIMMIMPTLLFSRSNFYDLINKHRNYVSIKKIRHYNFRRLQVSAYRLRVNMSGFVLHKVDNMYIKSYSVVVKSIDKKRNIAYLSYSRLAKKDYNKYLPTIKSKIDKKRDIVKIGYFYNNSIIISPNRSAYNSFINSKWAKNINWVLPDTLLFYMAQKETFIIKKPIIHLFCKNNNVYLLNFIVDRHVYAVDCNTLKVINKQRLNIHHKKRFIKPFYVVNSNILNGKVNMRKGFFGVNDMKSSYTKYYKKFLGIK